MGRMVRPPSRLTIDAVGVAFAPCRSLFSHRFPHIGGHPRVSIRRRARCGDFCGLHNQTTPNEQCEELWDAGAFIKSCLASGGAVTISAIPAIAGIPLATLLPLAVLLACPATRAFMARSTAGTHAASEDLTAQGCKHDPTNTVERPPVVSGEPPSDVTSSPRPASALSLATQSQTR